MRSITFEIPGEPSLTVTATEQEDGTILFELAVTGDQEADLRGLYFNITDPTLVTSLSITGDDVTESDFEEVSNFKDGNNVKGDGREPYDVGIDFGTSGIAENDISSTSFVLSSTTGDTLTLDMIANIEFATRMTSIGSPGSDRNGSQKISVIAPAAPDAIDDTANTLEDNSITINVVANDTDADGDILTVDATGVETAPANGVVTIINNQIVYTPNENWSGDDLFSYSINDGDGGHDHAEVSVHVEAVADAPNLALAVRAGSSVQEIIVDITSSLVDTDGSESYILTFDDLPAGVLLQGAVGGQIALPSGADSVTLVLAEGTDFNFDFTVNATSTEASNNDMATSTESVNIVLDFNEISENVSFNAIDQSIWTSGDEFVFTDNRFLGIDITGSGNDGGFITNDWSYAVKAGFQSDLRFEGGDIDAEIPWEFDFDTAFNRTTDVLTIGTSAAVVGGGSFATDGPSLEYLLDFVFNYSLDAKVGIYQEFGILGTLDETLFDIDIGSHNSINIVDFDSDTSEGLAFDFPYGITATLAWPNLEVAGTESTLGTYSGNGASNNALDINLDIDQALADIFLLGVNPFDLSANIGIAGGGVELFDVDVSAGLNFLQEFMLQAGTIDAELVFEDGSTSAFTFGDELTFNSASNLDDDGDGIVEFDVDLDLVGSTLDNDTDLGFNVGWNFDILKGNWWYDVFLASDSGNFGPAVDLGQSQIPVFDINVFDTTVDVAFTGESIDLFA